jgi:peptidoglycan/LPS O-acetylase OafA/YrhL
MTTKKSIHLKGLNGIRAIAALSVIVSHVTGDLRAFGLNDDIFGLDKLGNRAPILMASYGVTMFFALSGFLITYLLLLEKDKINTINVKKFYMRRVLRIWPLYYLYVILVLFVYLYFDIEYKDSILPWYIFLMANVPLILNTTLPYLGHLWSIGVEEQFYIIWPWFAKQSTKKLLQNSIVGFFILYLLKILFWLLSKKYGYSLPIIAITVIRFNIMLIGSIGAILYYNKSNIIEYITTIKVQLVVWTIFFLSILNKFSRS